jgi:class 3 adenylate cyclase
LGGTQTVSLLFTDLVGSTALHSRLPPDEADALRQEHFGLLRDAIDAVGGEEVKTLGDGIMAAFGGVASALSCAVGMQQRLERRNRAAAHALDVRIGVAVGDATREGDDWFGGPVIQAARLCAAADGGQILVTEAVHLLTSVADAPAMAPLGPLELKGLPEPVTAWSVEWERLAPQEGTPPLPGRLRDVATGGFVGRVDERQRLAAAWTAASGGEGGLAMICGEPGIGKTRLAAELAHEARDTGATVLYGRCDDEPGAPYQPWREALHRLVEVAPDDLLEEHVAGHGGELARLVPALSARHADVPPPRATDPETERYLLFGAAVQLLHGAAGRAPVLLILDDLHWATRPTLALVRHLHGTLSSVPLLVVATYREPGGPSLPLAELLADLRREARVERLALAGLGAEEAQTLLEASAGHVLDERGAAFAHELNHETGGNPFFLEEMVRHLAESGAIERDPEGRWTAATNLATLELPASIHEVVSGRVARLGPEAEGMLRAAAIIGREFDVDLLARVAGVDEDAALDVLEAASAAALVAEAPDRAGRFTFVHALVNHALTDELTGARRARLHARVARALEEHAAGRSQLPLGELAAHWAAVEDDDARAKACDYAARAGRAALASVAPDEAVRWFEQALELHDGRHGADPAERRELLLALGAAQLQAGVPAFRETLLDVAAQARDAGDAGRLIRAALANSRGYFSTAGFVDDDRVAVLEAALGVTDRQDPRRARLLALLAEELLWSPEAYARRRALSDEAVDLARVEGDPAALAHVLTLRITSVWRPETLAERLAVTAELVALSESGEDPLQRFWALVWRGSTALQAGDTDEADRCLDALRRLTARLGQPRLQFVLGTQETVRAQFEGRLDEADRAAADAVALGMETGEPDALSLYAAQLGPIRWQQGRLDEVSDLMGQIVEAAPAVAVFGALRALAELESGREGVARQLLEATGRDGFAGIPADPVRLGTYALWAEVAARLGAAAEAAALHARLEAWRDQVVLDALGTVGSAARPLGMLAAVLGRPEEADAHFAHAQEVHDRMRAPSLHARTQLDWGLALQRGARPGDAARARELLDRAAAETGRLGLAALQRRAREAVEAARVG